MRPVCHKTSVRQCRCSPEVSYAGGAQGNSSECKHVVATFVFILFTNPATNVWPRIVAGGSLVGRFKRVVDLEVIARLLIEIVNSDRVARIRIARCHTI